MVCRNSFKWRRAIATPKCASRRCSGWANRMIHARWNFLKRCSPNSSRFPAYRSADLAKPCRGAGELKLQRLEWDLLGGEEEFAGEGAIGGTAAESLFGGNFYDIGIIIFLRDMRKNEIARARVEALDRKSTRLNSSHGALSR